MKYFIAILLFLIFVFGLYKFFDVPYSSDVAKEYTIGGSDGK